MDTAAISEFLVQTASQRAEILGTHLGKALSDAFPELRSDPGYPGLKRFIQAHLADKLIRVAGHGGDDIYRAVRDGDAPAQPPPAIAAVTVWDAFQNPRATAKLGLDLEKGTLQIIPEGGEMPDDAKEIAPLTPDQHRGVAESFLDKVAPVLRPHFEQALQSPDYWPVWSKLVTRYNLSQEWGAHRFKKICELFRERVRQLGISEDLTELLEQRLVKERRESKIKEREAPLTASSGGRAPLQRAHSTREVVEAVIHSLSESQLRSLWLPVGDVIDALKHAGK